MSRFALSYDKGIRCGDEHYTIAIPDNFILEKGAENRAFIAWLPDGADDYYSADITFYDGKRVSENDNDTRIFTPEMSAALLENMFWSVTRSWMIGLRKKKESKEKPRKLK